MKKIILAVLIVFLMVGVILTSCKNDVNPVGEELVYVSFGEDSSRALIATLEDFDADDYWWSYEAQKNDGSGLISGQTAWDTTGEGAIPVQDGKGLTTLVNNNPEPTKVPGFSKGYWNFRLFAYIDSDRTQLALAYEGEADGVLIDSTNHMVNVVVSPAGTADGFLQIGTITFNPASAGSSAAYVVPTDTVYEYKNDKWVATEYTPDATGKYTLPAAQYKFTRVYKYEDIPVASGSVIVTVYSNLTTTISGSLSELTTYAEFGAEQNPDIIATTIGTDPKNPITQDWDSSSSVVFKTTAADKVSASMKTSAAQNLISKMEDDLNAKKSTSGSATSELTLNLSVNTTEATANTVTYEIGMEATLKYEKKDAQGSEKTTTTSTVDTLDDFVTVRIELQRGLSDVKVKHSDVDMTACASLDELNGKTKESTGAAAGFYFYQDPYNDPDDNPDLGPDYKKAMLYIRTYNFSPFTLSYKVPSFVAAIGTKRYESLTTAFSEAVSGDTVLILDDVALGEFSGTALNIGAGKSITLDLNGKTISGTATNDSTSALLEIPATSALTIVDSGTTTTGCITYKSTKPDSGYWYGTYTIYNFGTLTLEAGRIENTTVGGASYAIENHVNWTDSDARFYMNGGVVACANGDQAVRLYANNGNTPMNGRSIMVMTDGTIESGGIWCNMPQQPMGISLTISGGTVNGMLDFVSKGNKTNVTITGGTFNCDKLRIRANDNQTTDYILISGGNWTIGQIENQNAGGATENTMSISGGTYSIDPSDYVAKGYYAHDNENNTWTVKPVPAGAKVRCGNKFDYATVTEALADCTGGETIVLYDDITDSIDIKISNLTIDLNGHKITAAKTAILMETQHSANSAGSQSKSIYSAFKISECENVTIKNGEVESAWHVFIIGDHQWTIVKYKSNAKWPPYYYNGYHPMRPAKEVVLENITATALGSDSLFYFTNIEDDLTRANPSNRIDTDLYGNYIFKNGYHSANDSRSEVFLTPAEDIGYNYTDYKDSVVIKGGSYSANKLLGNMQSYSGDHLYREVLIAESGSFSSDEMGQFIDGNSYLVVNEQGISMAVEPPTDYAARVGGRYYCYEGGADDAIDQALFGETVYIRENASVKKVFTQGDALTVVYEVEGISYTGAESINNVYLELIETIDSDGCTHHFSILVHPVVAVYSTDQNEDWHTATKVGEYGLFKDAFNGLGSDDTIVLLQDITLGDDTVYKYSGTNYNCAVGYATRSTIDFNGHTITYTGTGACIFSSQQSGYLYFKDSVGGGGITAINGGVCVWKDNKSSDYTYFSGGTYKSYGNNALVLKGKGITISGGYYESSTTDAVRQVSIDTYDCSGSATIVNNSGAIYVAP
jgi:hypothetical protein